MLCFIKKKLSSYIVSLLVWHLTTKLVREDHVPFVPFSIIYLVFTEARKTENLQYCVFFSKYRAIFTFVSETLDEIDKVQFSTTLYISVVSVKKSNGIDRIFT